MPPDRRPALRINSIWDVYFSPARKADESSDSLLCLSALVLLPAPPLVPLLAASDTPLVMREKGGRDDGVDVDVGLDVVGARPGVVAIIVLPPPLLCRKLPPPPPPLRSNWA